MMDSESWVHSSGMVGNVSREYNARVKLAHFPNYRRSRESCCVSGSNIISAGSDISGKSIRVMYQGDMIFGRNPTIAEEWCRGTGGRCASVYDLK